MKKQFVIIFMSACSLGYAQIGVNTTNITSTLTVQGSISANYREVTATSYYLKQDDCNVGYSNSSNQDGVFYLPEYRYQTNDAFGRMYNIKNLTEGAVLRVQTQAGKSLKMGGLKVSDKSSYFLYPGQHLSVVADQNNDWVVYDYPTYVRKFVKIGSNLEGKMTVSMGDFSFRIKEEGRKGNVYLQVKSKRAVVMSCSTSMAWTDNSTGTRSYSHVIDSKSLYKDKWTFSHNEPGTKANPVMYYYNLINRVSIMTIKDTGEIYRVTISTFNDIYNQHIGMVVERLL